MPDNHLKGKTINVIGHSYVRNHKRPHQEAWHSLMAERNDMTYRNYGHNGNCIAIDRTKEGFGESMLERYKEMNDTADYVLTIGARNGADKIKNNPDSLEIFQTALHQLCEGLIEKSSIAKIAFGTPRYVNRSGFPQVTNAILEICGNIQYLCLMPQKRAAYMWTVTNFVKFISRSLMIRHISMPSVMNAFILEDSRSSWDCKLLL